MKALVTGATGFVGGHLVETLVQRGVEVTALVRSPGKAALLNHLGIRQIPGDLHDQVGLRAAVAEQDVVYHVAGLIAGRNEAEFLRANRDGTMNLVTACQLAGGLPRFILVSSMAAAGPAARGRPLLGEEPPHPVTQYGRSKLAAETVVRESRLRWTIIRPPMVYGPRDTEVLKVFRLVRAGLAPVFGDGSQELSAIYGPDLADALLRSAEASTTIGRTYYAAHPDVFRSREFVQRVGDALQRSPLILPLPFWLARAALRLTGAVARLAGRATILTADKANEFLQPAWTGDPGPLTKDTGWRAVHDLPQGLSETAAWYREQGWL